MSRKDLVEKLRKEEFGGKDINWQVSERRGKRMLYAETREAYFFRMNDTGTIIVQPKSPPKAMPYCYSCQGKILTVVREVYITENNEEEANSPFYQEWIGQTFPVAIPYCPSCDREPQDGKRFPSIEEFHHAYGKRFREILPI